MIDLNNRQFEFIRRCGQLARIVTELAKAGEEQGETTIAYKGDDGVYRTLHIHLEGEFFSMEIAEGNDTGLTVHSEVEA